MIRVTPMRKNKISRNIVQGKPVDGIKHKMLLEVSQRSIQGPNKA